MIRFVDHHAARLERMRPARVTAPIARQLELGADSIVKDAQFSILDGAISGPGHIPSLPGEAPNNDTGVLHDSGHVVPAAEIGSEIKAAAGFDAPYALFLELGTSRMHERPFLRPATEHQRRTVFTGLVARFREVVGL